MKSSLRHKSAPGFTLVELLVSVGIITVLVAILLPVMAGVRIYAKKVQCMSNLRQCGMAILSYANQNKGWLPYNDGGIDEWNPFSVCTNAAGTYTPDGTHYYPIPPYGIYNPNLGQNFSGALNDFIGDWQVWGCPSVGATRLSDPANQGSQLNSNYAVCWGTAGPTYVNPNPRKLAEFPDASHTVLVQDYATLSQSSGSCYVRTNHPVGGQTGLCSSYTWDAPGTITPTNPSDQTYYIAVHSTKQREAIDGINAVFLDFHVEWAPGGSLVSGGRDSNGWEWGSGAQRNFMTVKRTAW